MTLSYQIVLIKTDKTNALFNTYKIVPSIWTTLNNGTHQLRYPPPPYKEDDEEAIEEMVTTKLWPIPDGWTSHKCVLIEYADTYASAVIKLSDIMKKKDEKEKKAAKRKSKELDKNVVRKKKTESSLCKVSEKVPQQDKMNNYEDLDFTVPALEADDLEEVTKSPSSSMPTLSLDTFNTFNTQENYVSPQNVHINVNANTLNSSVRINETDTEKYTSTIEFYQVSSASGINCESVLENNIQSDSASENQNVLTREGQDVLKSSILDDAQQIIKFSDFNIAVDQAMDKAMEKFQHALPKFGFIRVSELQNIFLSFLQKTKVEISTPFGVRLNRLEKKLDDIISFLQNSPGGQQIFSFEDFVFKYKCKFPIKDFDSFNAFDKTLVGDSMQYQDLHNYLKSSTKVDLNKFLDSLNVLFQALFSYEVLDKYTAQRAVNGKLIFKSTNFYVCLKDALFKAYNQPGKIVLTETYLLSSIGIIISNYCKDWNGGREQRRKKKDKENSNPLE